MQQTNISQPQSLLKQMQGCTCKKSSKSQERSRSNTSGTGKVIIPPHTADGLLAKLRREYPLVQIERPVHYYE
jgi:hypothetical protein